ncbi:hypothetical protein NPIL_281141 [Nephila pilipes]|uniref:Uncharacterized protein n=1 Tax=Nephila pilipes TaxID=299642 RepID=A0A8X6IKG9_NEPPI|nr:hypothetical protein NPIL_281141 [Nephila pilipes]
MYFEGLCWVFLPPLLYRDHHLRLNDYSTTQFLNRVTTILETTVDAVLIPFPFVQKTCEALKLKSKLVPPQGNTTMTETPYKRSDQVATVPVVQSFSVWKM